MTKLTRRLAAIAELIEPCAVFADVGCDHGYMSLYVLEHWKANRVLCIDISLKCLEKTVRLLKRNQVDDQAIFYNCDGLKSVRQKPDEVLIAGMGGTEIINILYEYSKTRDLDSIETLIIQPMRDTYAVRKWLNSNGFFIVVDHVIKDGKIYHLIKAKRGRQKLTEFQLTFGVVEASYYTRDYLEWLREYEKKCQRILENAYQVLAVNQSMRGKLNQIQKQIKTVEEKIC